jgi:hypothetical protein
MERTIVEVDDFSDKVFRNFTPENKKQFNLAVSLMQKKAINDAGISNYKKLLDAIGNETSGNGLTPEILEEILASDD